MNGNCQKMFFSRVCVWVSCRTFQGFKKVVLVTLKGKGGGGGRLFYSKKLNSATKES